MAERGESIYLVGFMGCGKSTVGRLLAEAAGVGLLDTDAAIEAHVGTTIARLIDERGEAAFRAVESELFEREIAGRTAVVATGGGLPLRCDTRRTMRRSGRSIWIDVPLAACAERVGSAAGRPLWSGEDPLVLRGLFERRRAVYALCDLRIDGLGEPAEVARRALRALEA